MKRKLLAANLAVLPWTGAPSGAQAAAEMDTTASQRMERFERGLIAFKPGAPAAGGEAARLTLAERMSHYKVPGVSNALGGAVGETGRPSR